MVASVCAHLSLLPSYEVMLISSILSSAAIFLLVHLAPRALGRSKQSAVLCEAEPQLQHVRKEDGQDAVLAATG